MILVNSEAKWLKSRNSQGTLKIDFGINHRPILAVKVSKEAHLTWLRHSV